MGESQYYAEIEFYLEKLQKEQVRLDKDQTKEYVKVAQNLIADIIINLKRISPLFEKLYQETYYVGSYFDGLRVAEATEFDINIVLKFPFQLEVHRSSPGYVVITSEVLDKWPLAKRFFDGKVLTAATVFSWWQSIFDVLFTQYNVLQNSPVDKITKRKSGPAMTLHLDYRGKSIDIDIVPVLRFEGSPFDAMLKPYFHKMWFAVPKNDKWRTSFHFQEQQIMNGHNHFKKVLRFVKKLRDDSGNMGRLSSYYIKTVFLNETRCQASTFWSNRVAKVYLHMVNRLAEDLCDGSITYFWDRNLNMLAEQTCNYLTWQNYGSYLKRHKTPLAYPHAQYMPSTDDEEPLVENQERKDESWCCTIS